VFKSCLVKTWLKCFEREITRTGGDKIDWNYLNWAASNKINHSVVG